ncbi:hypothetical protein VUR80DRAFT_6015 [Thermomyces stellatus]
MDIRAVVGTVRGGWRITSPRAGSLAKDPVAFSRLFNCKLASSTLMICVECLAEGASCCDPPHETVEHRRTGNDRSQGYLDRMDIETDGDDH